MNFDQYFIPYIIETNSTIFMYSQPTAVHPDIVLYIFCCMFVILLFYIHCACIVILYLCYCIALKFHGTKSDRIRQSEYICK